MARIWRKWNIQPWRVATFKLSTDPELEAKVRDIVGLYLDPPQNAVVLCLDEKSQVQALDRTQPALPVRPGLPERQTHDYSATAPRPCSPRWTWPPARSPTPASTGTATKSSSSSSSRSPRPTRGCHCTWSATTTPPTSTRRSSLARAQPADHAALHPDLGVLAQSRGRVLRDHQRQAIRRGTHTSVDELVEDISRFIEGWNQRCEPFVWTKDADTILAKIDRKSSTETGH